MELKLTGQNSVSSILYWLLNIIWYFVAIGSIIFLIFISFVIITPPSDTKHVPIVSSVSSQINNYVINEAQPPEDIRDWENFLRLPLMVRVLGIIYCILILITLLQIIKKFRLLFKQFSNQIFFSDENITIISTTSKLCIVISILTLNVIVFLSGIALLIISDVFKKGYVIQIENDLTI